MAVRLNNRHGMTTNGDLWLSAIGPKQPSPVYPSQRGIHAVSCPYPLYVTLVDHHRTNATSMLHESAV